VNAGERAKPDLAIQEYLWNRGRITLLYIIAIVLIMVMLSVYIWQFVRMVEIQMSIETIDREMTETQ